VGTLTDTVMALIDTDQQTTIAENDDDERATGQLDSYIEWTCPASGVYKVLVRAYSTTETGRFQVRVTESGRRPQSTSGARCSLETKASHSSCAQYAV